ncbi:MAG: FkbM family methyltransferase [Alphaproteobacteria bacterium]|nr:FkbM family methyltransferase [Alphaproteobacteria bacterium]
MKLIYDLGFCDGADTAWYLSKGFRVVAVEADPRLADQGKERFHDSIRSGRLTLLNVGVAASKGTLPFYVNESNAHWSSFDTAYGCRGGTPFHVIEVATVTIDDLLRRYGCPYYMKIDIEGVDRIVLQQMRDVSCRPTHISVEEFGVATLDAIAEIGYTKARVVPQKHRRTGFLPIIWREGRYVPRKKFDGNCSGPFGRDLRLPWLTIDQARDVLNSARTDPAELKSGEWWDVHAT